MNRTFHDQLDGRQHCRNADLKIFFPGTGGGASKRAKSLCRTCPFRDACLQYALGYDLHGIWGGATQGERRKQQRAHGIHPTPVTILSSLAGANQKRTTT